METALSIGVREAYDYLGSWKIAIVLTLAQYTSYMSHDRCIYVENYCYCAYACILCMICLYKGEMVGISLDKNGTSLLTILLHAVKALHP